MVQRGLAWAWVLAVLCAQPARAADGFQWGTGKKDVGGGGETEDVAPGGLPVDTAPEDAEADSQTPPPSGGDSGCAQASGSLASAPLVLLAALGLWRRRRSSARGALLFAAGVGAVALAVPPEPAFAQDAVDSDAATASDAAGVPADAGESGDGQLADAEEADAPCSPDCEGKACGPDGCGGSCGACEAGLGCDAGLCVPATVSDGCVPSLIPGCGGCACEACVCALSPACCGEAWSAACTALCASECRQAVCAPTPVGCKGFCDGQSPDGCWCDADCATTGDCCEDACESCGACEPPGPGSCEGACGGQSDDGCFCDASCVAAGDCCGDACELCEACSTPAAASCEGFCGSRAPSGCYCDGDCATYGDCCADFSSLCAACSEWLTYEGCCSSDAEVVFCQDQTQLTLACAPGTACGWNSELAAYDCTAEPSAEPGGEHPRTCEALAAMPPEPDAGAEDAGTVADAESDDAAALDAANDAAVAPDDGGQGGSDSSAADGVADQDNAAPEPKSKGDDSGCSAGASPHVEGWWWVWLGVALGARRWHRRPRG